MKWIVGWFTDQKGLMAMTFFGCTLVMIAVLVSNKYDYEQQIDDLNKQIGILMSDTETGKTVDGEYEVLRATYKADYLIECENGMSYDLDRSGNWYDGRGNIIYSDNEKLTVVVSADTVIAIIRDTFREG